MSIYSLQKLLNLWAQGNLTTEQAIGQILQYLLAQEKTINDLKRHIHKLSSQRQG